MRKEELNKGISYINLDNLIKYDKGTYKGKINWNESIGLTIDGNFKGIDYKFKILSYDKKKQKVEIEYKDEVYKTYTSSIIEMKLGYILGLLTKEYKYQIGEIVNGGINDFKILATTRKESKLHDGYSSSKAYEVECIKCGYKDNVKEIDLKNRVSCRCCKNKIAVLGVNTIWDCQKWMIPIVGEEIAKTHVFGSSKYITAKCPYCDRIFKQKKQINKIYQEKGVSCICKDSISYPEKFIFKFLETFGVDFVYQLTSKKTKWVENKRYDFYFSLNNEDFIIEANGEQHPNTKYYNERSFKLSKENQIKNDLYKKKLALKNGIKEENYIVLDCSLSDAEFIKNEILKSRLSDIFDLRKVDWNECEVFALKNILKEICDYWNNKDEWETTTDLSKIFGISTDTVREYLKKGNKLGFCKYCAINERKIGKLKSVNKNKRGVVVLNSQGEVIQEFESISELVATSKKIFGVTFSSTGVSYTCKGNQKTHHGYIIKYVEDIE